MAQRLVVLMLDGFRWDYFNRDRSNLKGFTRLVEEGVQAESLIPVYPVESYPNWTTIGTGVYTDKHGICGNYMYDRNENNPEKATFQLMDNETTRRPQWWEHCPEPIWATAMRNGRRTFTRLWGRSDVPCDGVLPEEYSGYALAPGVSEIRDTLDIGLQKLLEGFDFILLYGEHIDNVGHAHGPDSQEMMTAVRETDEIISRFLTKLDETNLHDINLIVLSDHGMTATGEASGAKYINLEDYIDEEDVELCLGCGSYISITPAKGRLNVVYDKIKSMEGVDVFRREEIPDKYHYKDSKYVQELHICAKPNYVIRGLCSRDKQIPCYPRSKPYVEGVHGYTPDMIDQHGIFFARGPGKVK